MEKIKIYIDEDLSDRLAVALRSRGYDVISAHEINMRGKTDKEQLDYAIKHDRVILTRNIKHFIGLQREYYKKGLSHNGIVVTDYLPLKELIRRITKFLMKEVQLKQKIIWIGYKITNNVVESHLPLVINGVKIMINELDKELKPLRNRLYHLRDSL